MFKKKKEDFGKESVEMHKKYGGKLEIGIKVPVKSKRDLSLAYTPGIAQPCLEIQKDQSKVRDLVINGKTIAVITDGSAVLGLGNIGPKAALPVMEGKALLFKHFANLDSFPIALDTQDVEEFIKTVKYLAPSFGGINLEDISAPRCFKIEQRLKKELDIPVFHDDQHGTAIVVLAGLINAIKITNKTKRTVKIVMNGAGAAGVAITKILHKYGFNDITVCDSRGIVSRERKGLTKEKLELLEFTNNSNLNGTLQDALKGADIFIGVSQPNLINRKDIRTMNKDPIIFALSNPNPEITPDEAKLGGAKVIATGRSDFPNQVNNSLVFPGIFRGAIDSKAKAITENMKLEAAKALANLVKKPTTENIIPKPFDKGVMEAVSNAVKKSKN